MEGLCYTLERTLLCIRPATGSSGQPRGAEDIRFSEAEDSHRLQTGPTDYPFWPIPSDDSGRSGYQRKFAAETHCIRKTTLIKTDLSLCTSIRQKASTL